MKKLIAGIYLILVAASCQNASTGSTQGSGDTTKTDTIESTLNGLLKKDADTRVAFFLNHRRNDKTPDTINIWFTKAVIDSMCKVLSADSLGKYKPDGLRIYFLSKPAADTNAIPLDNNIAIVSTYNDGKTPHTDYFKHSGSLGLFHLDSIAGEKTINNNADTLMGAVLYKKCKKPGISCTVSPHDITRAQAEDMVQHFGKAVYKTKSEWFDIAMVDSLRKAMDTGKSDGIRIYFSRNVEGADTTISNKEAVIWVTTKAMTYGTKKIHKDSFDCGKSSLGKDKGGDPQDNGELCPTHCNGVTLP